MSEEKKVFTFDELNEIKYGDLKAKFEELGIPSVWKGGSKKEDLINKALGLLNKIEIEGPTEDQQEEEVPVVEETEVVKTEDPKEEVVEEEVVETPVETEEATEEIKAPVKETNFLKLEDTPKSAIMDPKLNIGLNTAKGIENQPKSDLKKEQPQHQVKCPYGYDQFEMPVLNELRRKINSNLGNGIPAQTKILRLKLVAIEKVIEAKS